MIVSYQYHLREYLDVKKKNDYAQVVEYEENPLTSESLHHQDESGYRE